MMPQWRAGINPGRTSMPCSKLWCMDKPQWRAGINPGRTGGLDGCAAFPDGPQWRAGINPGRTRIGPRTLGAHRGCRNGGPGSIPAGPALCSQTAGTRSCRNGGPGSIPAGRRTLWTMKRISEVPQWRAGINPGRTCSTIARPTDTTPAAMEGRDQSRPDIRITDPVTPERIAAMEGRDQSRPDPEAPGTLTAPPELPQWRAGINPGRTPPNGEYPSPPRGRNGGPGSIPAGPTSPPTWAVSISEPQWRAGINPGRTLITAVITDKARLPQWRAGINPGRTDWSYVGRYTRPKGRNGGPGSIPAGRGNKSDPTGVTMQPQWRAGINPGRTSTRPSPPSRTTGRNGGPGSIPAGRGRIRVTAAAPAVPQWRAGINPGRTGEL